MSQSTAAGRGVGAPATSPTRLRCDVTARPYPAPGVPPDGAQHSTPGGQSPSGTGRQEATREPLGDDHFSGEHMVALHTTIAIVLVIALIIKVRIDPVISLILGSLYLGLASGVGFAGTIEAITTGFGGIMAEVGLLIGFGVLIGSLLHSTGAFRRLVALLVQRVGSARLPY